MKKTYKLSDEQFKEAYWQSNGNCALTALYILKNFNIPYSRQAVHKRAKNFPDLILADIAVLHEDCYTGLQNFADDEKNDIRLRVRIYLHMQKVADRAHFKLLSKNRN